MSTKQMDDRGFSSVETVLIVVVVVAIGLIGWYVYHVRRSTNNTYNTVNNSSGQPRFNNTKAASGDTSNSALVTSLQDATSAANQGNKDMSDANNSLNDQSTLTSVPQ